MRRASTMKLLTGITLASAFVMSSVAQANIIYSVSGPGVGDAQTAEGVFRDQLQAGAVTEGFEGFDTGLQGGTVGSPLVTSIGAFVGSGDANGQSCSQLGFTCGEGLGIVEGDFYGRFPLPDVTENTKYLDSLDHSSVLLTLNEGYNALGFYLTDPNDSGGILDIVVDGVEETISKSIDDILGGSQRDAGAFYLSFFSTMGDISSITFTKNNTSDGIGFDNVTVGRVPEPGTLALLGLGLAGLTIARRRNKA